MVTRFSYTLFSVFDSLGRTIADAGHAVRAFLSPDRLLIDQADIIYRTSPDTLPTACACIARPECFGLNNTIENRIDRTAHQAIIKVIPGRRESFAIFEMRDNLINTRFCSGYDLPCLLRLRRPEHRNIIFRHNNLSRSHVTQMLSCSNFPIVPGSISDLSAAVHHEPDASGVSPFCSGYPCRYNPWNSPGICRSDKDYILTSLDRRCIPCLDPGIQIYNVILQCFRNSLCNIAAVAGSRKTENHILNPPSDES